MTPSNPRANEASIRLEVMRRMVDRAALRARADLVAVGILPGVGDCGLDAHAEIEACAMGLRETVDQARRLLVDELPEDLRLPSVRRFQGGMMRNIASMGELAAMLPAIMAQAREGMRMAA